MMIENFDDALRAACQQPQPQQLLFVFARAELPDDASPVQRAAFEAGEGGTLLPIMCVDKSPDSLTSFAKLVGEAGQFAQDWSLVFLGALSGGQNSAPSDQAIDQALNAMVERIKRGEIGDYLAFDKMGNACKLV
jgi:hypothetical protein